MTDFTHNTINSSGKFSKFSNSNLHFGLAFMKSSTTFIQAEQLSRTLISDLHTGPAIRGLIKEDEIGQMTVQAMDLTINPQRELVGVRGDIVMHRI